MRLKVAHTIARGNGVRHVGHSLRSLANCDRRDYLILERVNRGDGIGIFETDIDPRAVARWPEAMGQRSRLDCCNLIKIVGAKHFYGVQSADRHIGELTLAIPNDIYVVGNRPSI